MRGRPIALTLSIIILVCTLVTGGNATHAFSVNKPILKPQSINPIPEPGDEIISERTENAKKISSR